MAAKPKLIVSLTSPYARKVRIAALEKGIEFEMVVDVPWNEDTGVIKTNPLGKVPVWLEKIGQEEVAVFDSRVITDYLDKKSGPTLIPAEPSLWLPVKVTEALAEGVMDASLALFAERRKRPAELQHPWWVERQFGKVHRGLFELNRQIHGKDFFVGKSLTIADIAVASALGYIGLRFSEDFDWQQRYPALANFYASMMKRPSVSSTVPIV